MNDKPQSVAIGAFVVGAALIALVAALFLAGATFGEKEKIVMVFDGSVKGLNVGAPVAVRGVQVGQVSSIKIVMDASTADIVMVVEADFDPSAIHLRGEAHDEITEELLERGLRAQLNTQSLLTGLLYVQMDFFPGTELVLREVDSPYFQFPTIPTDLERITQQLQDIDFNSLIEEISTMSRSLSDIISSEEMRALPSSLNDTLLSVRTLSDELAAQLATTGPKLDSMLDETTATMASANDEIPRLSQLVVSNLEVLDDAIVAFEKTMGSVDGLVSADSATTYRLNQALREISRAGRALQSLARTLEEQPEALIRGKSGDD